LPTISSRLPGSIPPTTKQRHFHDVGPKHYSTQILKLICLTIIQLAKQAWLLPQSIANAVQQRRRQTVLNELEAERLDRIRNPDKYLGKLFEARSSGTVQKSPVLVNKACGVDPPAFPQGSVQTPAILSGGDFEAALTS